MIADGQINCVFLSAMLKIRHPSFAAQLSQILLSHGIAVRILDRTRDIWTRDYCPIQVGPENLVKFRYEPDYLKDEPQLRTTGGLAKFMADIGRCRRSDINLDGGNIVTSGTKAVLTDKIYKENPEQTRADLRNDLQRLLQVEQIIMVPKEPFDPFGHTDSMVRFIDQNSVLVNDYSKVDREFGQRLVESLRRDRLEIELLPYAPEKRTKAGIPSAVGCFTNFLRTERVLVVPIYGMKQDDVALKTLEAAFPGLPIEPLDCTDLAREGGVLNCISGTYHISTKSS